MSKIGLALGSGAARGLAHIGVLKALRDRDISIDMIAGSSMGALVGACFARRADIVELEELILKTDFRQLLQLADPNIALMFRGFIHGHKVKELLRTIIGDIEFRDLKIPLAVVATDINTGEEIVIKEGSVVEAVRASISIPVIFMPVKLKNRFLVDGGIVNPIPVNVIKDMGATFVLACNVMHKPQVRKAGGVIKKQTPNAIFLPAISHGSLSILNKKINRLLQDNKDKMQNFQKLVRVFGRKNYKRAQRIDPNTPNIFDAIMQVMYVMEYEIARFKIKEADVIITPDTSHIAALEFYRGKEAIAAGYQAVENILPHLPDGKKISN